MATLASMTVRLGIDTDQLQAGADRAKKILTGVGKAVAALGAGIPAAAAAAVAVGGMAAAAVSAGAAYKAFQLAAGPQMEAVRSVSELAAAAEEAAAEGGEKAAAAQKAYTDALGKLPAATRATAKEFMGLKKDQQAWSDSLSGTTMPVYTKALQLLRRVLPLLTPLVKAAAGAFKGFLDDIGKGMDGGGPKRFADSLAKFAGENLTSFLNTVKNFAVGFAGIITAFLPASTKMSGGLESASKSFADWGSSLDGSDGFAQFLDLARQGATTIGTLATAAGNLLVAVSPLLGVTAVLATQLANVINSTPAPVLKVLAGVLVAVRVAMILYSAGTAAVALGNRIMASSAYTAIAGWTRMMAVGLMAYIRIAAGAVASAATTAAAWVGSALVSIGTWIAAVVRAGITAAAQFVMMAARAVAWAVVMAAQWLIAMGPVGWVIAAIIGLAILIIANWDRIKKWTAAAWNWIWSTIKGVAAGVVTAVTGAVARALGAWDRFKTGAVAKAAALVAWMRGLPGRLSSALSSLGSLLISKGRAVVQGLWSGIQSMGGWIRSKLVSWARSMIPGPIAKALGIASPSKVTTGQGRWIGRGLVVGLTGTSKQVKAAATKIADIVRDGLKPGAARSKALGKISAGSRQLVALASRETALAARMKTASKSLSDQIKARDKLTETVRKGVMDSANITQLVQDVPVTADSLLTGLTARVDQAKKFAADLAQLRKKGVSADLIAQIASAGVDQGAASAAALAQAGGAQIKAINAQQAAVGKAATAAGNVAGNAMYGSGINAARGLIQGLKSQQKAVEKQMLTIAQGMQKAIRKALGIKSPSRVMAALGRYIPAGLTQGIDSGQGAVDQTMRHLVDVPGMKQVRPDPAAAAAVADRRLVLDVTGADDDWKRMFRRMVKDDAGGDVVRFAGGTA